MGTARQAETPAPWLAQAKLPAQIRSGGQEQPCSPYRGKPGPCRGLGRSEAPGRPRGSAPARASPQGAPGRAGVAAPAPPLTADDGADEGGVPRAVDQRELELAGPRAQLRRQGGAQAGEAQVQRDAPRPALRRPVEGGGGAGGAQRPRQRRLPAVDVAQDAHVHVEDAGRRGPGGHDGAAPGRSVPTAPLRQRGPRRLRSAAAASDPGRREIPSLPRQGYTREEHEVREERLHRAARAPASTGTT